MFRIDDVIRRIALAAGAVLGVFHAWLLGHQAWTGELSDPATVLRWIAALILLGGLLSLRRRGIAMVFSRPAVAMWVLAALLHGPAIADDLQHLDTAALPEVVVAVGRTTAALAALSLALLVWSRYTLWTLGVAAGYLSRREDRLLPCAASTRRLGLLPRPPPLV